MRNRPMGAESAWLGRYVIARHDWRFDKNGCLVVALLEWRPNLLGRIIGKTSYQCGEIVDGGPRE